MKIAVFFLVAALCSSYTNSASVSQPNCLTQLFQDDAPVLLQSLATLLCEYKFAKANNNAALFQAFLQKVNVLLGKVGCTIDNLLGTNVIVTLKNAEQIGDQVAQVLFQYVNGIIAKVLNVLDEIPLLNNLLKYKILITDIQAVACQDLEKIIQDVDKVLKYIGNIAGNLTQKQ